MFNTLYNYDLYMLKLSLSLIDIYNSLIIIWSD